MTRKTRSMLQDAPQSSEAVAEEVRRRVHTLRAARVLSYTVDPPQADVQLVHREIKRSTGGEQVASPYPPLLGVPVLWPSGGGRGMVWGLDVGDPVYVAVREVDHDGWDAGQRGEDQTPTHDRRHDWSDAVVIPMDTLVGRSDGAPVILLASGDALRVGSLTAGEGPAIASALREELDAIWSAIYGGHTHPYLQAIGPGVTGTTAAVSSAASGVPDTRAIASTRLLTDDTVTPGVGVT
jgi:hypothetical protein